MSIIRYDYKIPFRKFVSNELRFMYVLRSYIFENSRRRISGVNVPLLSKNIQEGSR